MGRLELRNPDRLSDQEWVDAVNGTFRLDHCTFIMDGFRALIRAHVEPWRERLIEAEEKIHELTMAKDTLEQEVEYWKGQAAKDTSNTNA